MGIAFTDNLLTAGAGLFIVCLAGYGAARWLLPGALRPWFWVSVPLVGACVTAVSFGWLNLILPMQLATPAFLVIALLAAAAGDLPGSPLIGRQAKREQAIAGLMAVVALVVALAPLWGRPDLVSIGPNWDIEIYIPMAEYLK